MIKNCHKCGGLYATEDMESFGGSPCRCLKYAMKFMVVTADLLSDGRWRLYGPWAEPIHIDDECFRRICIAI